MWLFNPFISSQVNSVIKARGLFSAATVKALEDRPISYFLIFNYHFKQNAMDDNIATVSANIQIFRQ